MRTVYEYSHLGGAEIMQVRYASHLHEIAEVIASVTPSRSKISREKTMVGKELYSPREMNQQFRDGFAARGYAEIRDTYTITLPNSAVEIPGAFKQVDFVKDRVLVEVQFGKYASMFYDMAKFRTSSMRTRRMSVSRSCRVTCCTEKCQPAYPTASSWCMISNA